MTTYNWHVGHEGMDADYDIGVMFLNGLSDAFFRGDFQVCLDEGFHGGRIGEFVKNVPLLGMC